ncbi:coproporphyrinogen-III oxidase family protein [Microseira wollei]|uniref:Coproporphyrinogen III oxidase, anaerobic n=1 Tax=Microseira wollei NIES-4236 TaxID=2530354 RepID=A0AAV3XIB1_9CYAN|nr:radical SAM protein [Microseira wollei]GET41308.1 coproporphyrinogen III oxidase, anaerobic [Microseira wollei NIES-4236]
MFDLKLAPKDTRLIFNQQLPFFNWYYPFELEHELLPNPLLPFLTFEISPIKRFAVYIHIPFCETICSFCPFTRGRYNSEQDIQDYIDALFCEIQLKRNIIGQPKIDTVFIGGGTPSVLSPKQIEVLGHAIHTHFNTQELAEFTFELEVKSVTYEKLKAMQRIGVNRISFGAQTFTIRHRELFSLDATVCQIRNTAQMANEVFAYTNVDMIYGMAGQTPDDLYHDVNEALSLQTTTVDFYPLNNLAAQTRMYRMMRETGLQHLSATQRMQYRYNIDNYLRARGYSKINGYSYSRSDKSNQNLIQHHPKFQYHDIVYGYQDDSVLGYGASALTQMPGYNIYNHPDRAEYISRIRRGMLAWEAFGIDECFEKGIVTFPYRGVLNKSRIAWEYVHSETLVALEEAIRSGLVLDREKTYELTYDGWLYYVNLMYYLMPNKGKKWISNRIGLRIASGNECEHTVLDEHPHTDIRD